MEINSKYLLTDILQIGVAASLLTYFLGSPPSTPRAPSSHFDQDQQDMQPAQTNEGEAVE